MLSPAICLFRIMVAATPRMSSLKWTSCICSTLILFLLFQGISCSQREREFNLCVKPNIFERPSEGDRNTCSEAIKRRGDLPVRFTMKNSVQGYNCVPEITNQIQAVTQSSYWKSNDGPDRDIVRRNLTDRMRNTCAGTDTELSGYFTAKLQEPIPIYALAFFANLREFQTKEFPRAIVSDGKTWKECNRCLHSVGEAQLFFFCEKNTIGNWISFRDIRVTKRVFSLCDIKIYLWNETNWEKSEQLGDLSTLEPVKNMSTSVPFQETTTSEMLGGMSTSEPFNDKTYANKTFGSQSLQENNDYPLVLGVVAALGVLIIAFLSVALALRCKRKARPKEEMQIFSLSTLSRLHDLPPPQPQDEISCSKGAHHSFVENRASRIQGVPNHYGQVESKDDEEHIYEAMPNCSPTYLPMSNDFVKYDVYQEASSVRS